MDDLNAIFVRYFNNPIRVVRYSYDSKRTQFTYPSETYPEWSLIAVEEGEFEFRVEKRQGRCGFGEWVLCPPGVAFEREMRHQMTFHFSRFEWDVEPPQCPLIGLNTTRDTARYKSNLAHLRKLKFPREEMQQTFHSYLLQDLLRLAWWENVSAAEANLNTDAAMETVRRFLEENASRPVSLREVAKKHRLTPVALTRRFSAAQGCTPSDYLTRIRLECARTLLLQTNLTIDTIASQCGLGNGFYLSRVWAKKWGGTPSHFRREHQV